MIYDMITADRLHGMIRADSNKEPWVPEGHGGLLADGVQVPIAGSWLVGSETLSFTHIALAESGA